MRSPYTTSDAVIIEKVIGEPPPKTTSVSTGAWITITAAMAVLIGLVWLVASGRLVNSSGEKFSAVKEGGCDLRVVSLYDHMVLSSTVRGGLRTAFLMPVHRVA